jgi:hypothetical protein
LTNKVIIANPNKYNPPITKYKSDPVNILANTGPIIPAIPQPDNVIAWTVDTQESPNRFASKLGKQEKLQFTLELYNLN